MTYNINFHYQNEIRTINAGGEEIIKKNITDRFIKEKKSYSNQ